MELVDAAPCACHSACEAAIVAFEQATSRSPLGPRPAYTRAAAVQDRRRRRLATADPGIIQLAGYTVAEAAPAAPPGDLGAALVGRGRTLFYCWPGPDDDRQRRTVAGLCPHGCGGLAAARRRGVLRLQAARWVPPRLQVPTRASLSVESRRLLRRCGPAQGTSAQAAGTPAPSLTLPLPPAGVCGLSSLCGRRGQHCGLLYTARYVRAPSLPTSRVKKNRSIPFCSLAQTIAVRYICGSIRSRWRAE